MATSPEVQRVRAAILRAVTTPILFMALLGAVLVVQIQQLVAGTAALDHSDEMIARVDVLEREVVERESDLRGYLLRRQSADLTAYDDAVSRFAASWDDLARSVGDPDDIALLREIRSLERQWDTQGRNAIVLPSGDEPAAEVAARRALMQRIRSSFRALAEREQRRRAARSAATKRRVDLVLGSSLALTIAAGIAIAVYERARIRSVERAFTDALDALRAREVELGRAVEARDDFIHAASHELKSPLTALGLQSQLLARKLGNDARVEIVQRSVARLAALVDRLLDTSRLASGRIDLDPEAADLAAVVSEVSARMAGPLSAAGCTLDVRATSVVGLWDPMRLEQIATNLLTNAMKYGRGKPVEVSIEPDGDRAKLVVRDHGIGIAPEDQARIFERFARAVPDKAYSGLGLGLWIVKEIVEAMSGTIEVRSERGEGATFLVTLPRGEVAG